MSQLKPKKIELYEIKDIDRLPQLQKISTADRLAMKAVAQVLPFRVNNYVVEELIDWENIPNDPIFRLTFPQKEMLTPESLDKVIWHLQNSTPEDLRQVVNTMRSQLNPHPAGQVHNIPTLDGKQVPGIQHKYPETVLIFPTAGQTCHAYCTFCFRWPQFVKMDGMKFATRESGLFQEYLRQHQEVTDVLITGGDPMTMKARHLALYIEPLLNSGFEHIQTIRIGTKSIAYWPYRFVTDEDADDILRLFEKVTSSGKHLSIMAHYDHPTEIKTEIAQAALQRIRSTGAQIRTQGPLMRGINDSPQVWIKMWKEQVRLGCIPYYMFMERDTGAKHCFEVPIIRAWEIYQTAIQKVSGLARTARGPVMSALPGKVAVDGVTEIYGEKVFVLSFLQGRDPNWCKRPFFARYDEKATWLTDLVPAMGEKEFFYENKLQEILKIQS
ncbi:lysine 2,3-aminomutase [Nostoc sp. KVJ20]|uniref:KamA family radical SAM protein n=1 Tax=Nostoc sp. KVJ20 TaxID=457944 RepID=UPI00083CCAE9|nr:lysine 2,3-aminomutase [Nostoc sp. KVJ20]ODH01741.1 lysine 2,3-aminomutase [Nostoc sp. KVJ20]